MQADTDQVIGSYERQDASYNDIHSVIDEPWFWQFPLSGYT